MMKRKMLEQNSDSKKPERNYKSPKKTDAWHEHK